MDYIERFREAIKIPTWQTEGSQQTPLLQFQEFLVNNFPAFHKTAERVVLNPYSVLYRWPGAEKGDGALFLAHYDVVPAETEKWNCDPFGAELKDGYVYGRGTLDMKGILIGIMEAAENLCAAGFKPKRDVWIALGGDEERSGTRGAQEAVKWLSEKGVRFSWLLDEGTPVQEGQIAGVSSPLALVSIEEKGYLSLNLDVAQDPGHASRPPKVQAAAVLGRALCRIVKKPFPFSLVPTVESFFKQASGFMKGAQGFALKNARALGPLFFKVAAGSPTIASMLRTTVAITQLEGSAADNVLPSQARAVINLRLLHPWTIERAIEFIRSVINDERVKVSVHGLGSNPVPAKKGYEQAGWPEIKSALEKSWPGIPMLPFIMIATTDSRHYKEIAGHIFRFSPHKMTNEDLGGVHGHNERISIDNLNKGLQFYKALMEQL
jgi:carboxypeptidase PM20D1